MALIWPRIKEDSRNNHCTELLLKSRSAIHQLEGYCLERLNAWTQWKDVRVEATDSKDTQVIKETKALVSCKIKKNLLKNSVFYFTRNHIWNRNKEVLTANS